MTRVRPLAVLVLSAALAASVAACGSAGETFAPASSTTDVDQLLRETFSGDHRVDSGRVDLTVRVDKTGGHGSAGVRPSGAFQSQGEGRLPKFALDAEGTGAGPSLAVGATSTGDAGYVNVLGRDYQLAGPVFARIEAGYEEAEKQAGGSFPALGLDPRRWLKDPRLPPARGPATARAHGHRGGGGGGRGRKHNKRPGRAGGPPPRCAAPR